MGFREDERRAKREKETEERVIVRPAPKDIPKNNRTPERKMQDNQGNREPDRKKPERRQRQIDHQYDLRQQKVKIPSIRDDWDLFQMAACDELLSYLILHNPVKEPAPVESKAESVASQTWLPSEAGMKKLKKSENEERDAWLLGGKGKKTKHKKPKKSAKVEKPEDKILMHSLQTLEAFHDLRIRVPDTLADVPNAIQALEDLKLQLQTSKTHQPTNNPEKTEHQKEDSTEAAMNQTAELEQLEDPTADGITDAIEDREQGVSVTERTKSNLPATLEDLDPLESASGEILSTDGMTSDPRATSESPIAEDVKTEKNASEIYVHCHFTSNKDMEIGIELEVSNEPVP